jgi:transcriptional regulator with XRE-family HTH domain
VENRIDAELARISGRIRACREAENLTLQELAQRSEVATSTIQKVETEQMIPSVAVILKIARGLGLGLADLVSDRGEELEVIHLRSDERHPIGVPGKMVVERLSGDLVDSAVEVWRVTLHPGVSSGSDAILYNGEELVIGEEGEVTIRLGNREHTVAVGDSLHFKASIPHSWRNDGRSVARFTVTGNRPREFRALLHERVARATDRPSAG